MVDQAHQDVLHLRGSVIHHSRDPEGSALAQRFPVHNGVSIRIVGDVVFRRQSQGNLQLVPLTGALGAETDSEAIACVQPLAVIAVVIGSGNAAREGLCQDFSPFAQVPYLEAGCRRIPNGRKVDVADLVPIYTVDGVALRHIMLVLHHRVAAEVIAGARCLDIGNQEAVATDAIVVIQVGIPFLIAHDVFGAAAYVIHRGVRPVAVEAQHRDGMLRSLHALLRDFALGVYKSFHICARRIVRLKLRLLLIRQDHGDLDVCLAASRNRNGLPGAEFHSSVQSSSLGVQIAGSVFRKHSLGEKVGRQLIGERPVRQVVDGEGELVGAGSLGIVSQLHLHLAVGIGPGSVLAHEEIALCQDSCTHIGKASALPQDGIIGSAVLLLPLRDCCGHKQTLGQLSGRQAGLFRQARLPNVLGQQGRHAGHLGRGHRCAGHALIRIGPSQQRAACFGLVTAVQGVDVTAGGGDLRLHLQRARHTPRGEVAHGVVRPRQHLGANAFFYSQLALIVQHVALAIGDRGGLFL